jgi:hypothetical protein
MAKFIKVFDAASGSMHLKTNAIVVTTDAAIMADTTTAQTLTNKTLTSPTITGATQTSPAITNATLGVFHQTIAGLGTTVADAAAINSTVGSVLATGGNNSVGVLLPVASAGRIIFLKNQDSDNGIMKVYAQVNSTINAIAANSAIAMAAKTSAVFMGTSATNWITIPLLPS